MKKLSKDEVKLLLTDLSGRLFYNPIVKIYYIIANEYKEHSLIISLHSNTHILSNIGLNEDSVKELYKIYLRPKSDLTPKELDELSSLDFENNPSGIYDYYDEHMIDYRNLIEKGLAEEATENMKNYWYTRINENKTRKNHIID